MADQTALTAIGSSGARQCQQDRRGERQQSNVPAAPDRLAPKRSVRRPAARQRPLPDAEIVGGEVSFWTSLASRHSITSSALFAERDLWNVRSRPHPIVTFAALMIGVQRAISLFTNAASGCGPRLSLP